MHPNTTLALGLTLAVIAATLPTPIKASNDTELNIREANRAWIPDYNPDDEPNATVELHHGGTVEHVTAAQAMERTLDRAGDTSLPDLTAPTSHGEMAPVFMGYIWIIGTGEVDCGTVTYLAEIPGAPYRIPDEFGEQLQPHVGYTSGVNATTYWIEAWTMGDGIGSSGAVHYGGVSNFYCIDGDGMQLPFPFVHGYAVADSVLLPSHSTQGLPGSDVP